MATFAYEKAGSVVPGGMLDVPTSNAPSAIPSIRFAYERDEAAIDATVISDIDPVSLEAVRTETEDTPVTKRFYSSPRNITETAEHVKELSSWERIARAFHKGGLESEIGKASYLAMKDETSERLEHIASLKERVEGLGLDPKADDFISWVQSAAKVTGQMVSTFGEDEAALRVGGGGAIGALLGPAGVAAGLATGSASHFTISAYEKEGGNTYIALREMGVSRETALWLGATTGLINSAFETASAGILLKPLSNLAKQKVKDGIQKAMISPTVRAAATKFTGMYGAGIAGEVITEVLQELTQIGAEEWAKRLEDLDVDAISQEKLQERLEEIAVETFKAMVFLAAPGPGVQFASNVKKAHKARKTRRILDELNEALQESKAAKAAPEEAVEHMSEVLQDQGFERILVPADKLAAWAQEQEDSAQIIRDLGLSEKLPEALALGQDIEIETGVFVQNIMLNPDAQSLIQHLRENEEALTSEEAREYLESDFMNEVQAGIDAAAKAEVRPETAHSVERLDEITSIATEGLRPGTSVEAADQEALATGTFRLIFDENVEEISGETTTRSFAPDLPFKQTSEVVSSLKRVEIDIDNLPAHVDLDTLGDQLSAEFETFPKDENGETIVSEVPNEYWRKLDRFNEVFDRQDKGGITAENAVEQVKTALAAVGREDVEVTAHDGQKETEQVERKAEEVIDPDIQLARDELGLNAFFQTAEEAGMTPKQFEAYLVKVQKAADASVARLKEQELKKEAKKATADYRRERQKVVAQEKESLRQQTPAYQAVNNIQQRRLNREQVFQAIEDMRLPQTNIPRLDSLGVRVKDTTFAEGVDAAIADHLQALYDAGYIPVQSMSGIFEDYENAPTRYTPDGYMAFTKYDLGHLDKIEQIRAAAKEAQLYFEEGEIFGSPSVIVRSGLTKEEVPFAIVLEEAGERALADMNLSPDELAAPRESKFFPGKMLKSRPKDTATFKEWLLLRDTIHKEIIAEHGGHITDEEIQSRWDTFTSILTGETFQPSTDTVLTAKNLPTQERNRRIYAANQSEETVDLDLYAELHNYRNGQEMLVDMLTTPDFNTALDARVNEIMAQRHEEFVTQQQRIAAAREALHSNSQAQVLEAELNALREAKKQKRLSAKLIRLAAKDQLNKTPIREISAVKFLNAAARLGKQAGKALRKGDRDLAILLKTQQVLNFHMAKEAYRLQIKHDRQVKWLKKLQKMKNDPNMPINHQRAIAQLLDRIGFFPRLSEEKRTDMLQKLANSKRNPVRINARLLDDQREINYKDMTLSDWEELVDTVTAIQKAGRSEQKLRKVGKEEELASQVEGVVEAIETNILPKKKTKSFEAERSLWNRSRKYAASIRALLYNADTILREIDGFKNLGHTYTVIKGKYDRALAEGYNDGQVGYLDRRATEAQAIKSLFDIFTPKEKNAFQKPLTIPGASQQYSHHTILAVLLNLGNEQNYQAMVESNTLPEQDIRAIHEFASEKDWQFAQSVWDYLNTFFPEVVATEQRRRNYTPEQVQATAIETKYGTFKGGYYPIRHGGTGDVHFSERDADKALKEIQLGGFVTRHTRRGHVEARLDTTGKPVVLDLFVLNSHVDQVIYDLEVGDALHDVYKVLHDPSVKKAFAAAGIDHKWESLDLWFRDVVTGELGVNSATDRGLRWIRSGLTIAKLGWNLGVISLQVLGIAQTAVQIGKLNTMHGLRVVLINPWLGKRSAAAFATENSAFMRARMSTLDKDISDAQTIVQRHLLDKVTNEKTASFIRESFFWGIKKTQRFTDLVTWYGALKQGMEEFGNFEEASRHADRIVARSQASGIFGERTAFERGSVSKNRPQQEWVRAFTLFMSYFAAKTNVAIERTKTTNFKSPLQIVSWAGDMMLLYVVEALLAGLIRGQWPEEDDEETFIDYTVKESVNQLMGGVPILREAAPTIGAFLVGEASPGFTTGGSVGNVLEDFAKMGSQAAQGELDADLLKRINNMGGTFLKYPASQINKTTEAFIKAADGEDVTPLEFLMGPHFER